MIAIPKSMLIASGGAASVAAAAFVGYMAYKVSPAAPPAPASISTTAPADKPVPAADKTLAVETKRPQFDVVRVEPTGESVIAGQAEPNAAVILLNRGLKIAEGKADSNGQFVILPPALAPGDHLLTLRSIGANGDVESEQSVATAVPRRAGEQVMAALAAPGQPTRLLGNGSPSSAAPAGLAIGIAEAGEDGAFLASGTAMPGASIRLYLNNAFVAPVEAGPDGKWSLKIERGMTPGHYDIRADAIDQAGAKVIARAEAPFDYPEAKTARTPAANLPKPLAEPASQKSLDRPALAAATPGEAVVREIQSVTVERGDSLWRISRKVLGRGVRYTQIYSANAAQIRDPNKIWPGQIFVAPKARAE